MSKATSFISVPVIVENLRGLAKDIAASKIENVVIPLTATLNDKYPMGIQSGNYTKKELADAIHFLADMLE